MAYSDFFKNAALDAVLVGVYVSAHTADPGVTGANEVSGGIYTRQSISFAAAFGGEKASSSEPVLDIPAVTTVAHVGFWDDPAAGNFLGGADVTDESFAAAGTYTVTSAILDLNNG